MVRVRVDEIKAADYKIYEQSTGFNHYENGAVKGRTRLNPLHTQSPA